MPAAFANDPGYSGNWYITTGTTTAATAYYQFPVPEPARLATSLDWLRDEVDKVCAEARKVRLS